MHELLTIKETAIILGIKEDLVKNWVRSNVLEYIVLPNRGLRHNIRIKRSSVEDFINKRGER